MRQSRSGRMHAACRQSSRGGLWIFHAQARPCRTSYSVSVWQSVAPGRARSDRARVRLRAPTRLHDAAPCFARNAASRNVGIGAGWARGNAAANEPLERAFLLPVDRDERAARTARATGRSVANDAIIRRRACGDGRALQIHDFAVPRCAGGHVVERRVVRIIRDGWTARAVDRSATLTIQVGVLRVDRRVIAHGPASATTAAHGLELTLGVGAAHGHVDSAGPCAARAADARRSSCARGASRARGTAGAARAADARRTGRASSARHAERAAHRARPAPCDRARTSAASSGFERGPTASAAADQNDGS